ELERSLEVATRSPSGRPLLPVQHPCLRESDRLANAVVQTLIASAGVLTGSGPPPDLCALQAAWCTHRMALDRWAGQALRAGAAPEDVFDGWQANQTLRVVAYLTLAVGSNAAIAGGAHVDAPEVLPIEVSPRAGATGFLQRVGQTIRTHLAPTSSVLHNSLR